MGVGPSCHYDALILHGAGGKFGVTGEYLYRDYVAWGTDGGMWGLFNVATGSTPSPDPPVEEPVEPEEAEPVGGAGF